MFFHLFLVLHNSTANPLLQRETQNKTETKQEKLLWKRLGLGQNTSVKFGRWPSSLRKCGCFQHDMIPERTMFIWRMGLWWLMVHFIATPANFPIWDMQHQKPLAKERGWLQLVFVKSLEDMGSGLSHWYMRTGRQWIRSACDTEVKKPLWNQVLCICWLPASPFLWSLTCLAIQDCDLISATFMKEEIIGSVATGSCYLCKAQPAGSHRTKRDNFESSEMWL